MASRWQFLLRSLALLVLLAVVGVIIQETSTSAVHVAAQQGTQDLRQRIDDVTRQNADLADQLTYAQSLSALREIAKRELGLVDPGDRAIVILDDVPDRPAVAALPLPTPAPPTPEPIQVGYLNQWLALLFVGESQPGTR